MKKENISNRRSVIAGGLAALCAIVSLAMSVPVKADVSVLSDVSTSENPEAQQPAAGMIDGHDYVDLGLSVIWATCNVGASSLSDYGDYFAWGETTPKSEYTFENYDEWMKDLGDISGNPQYDAARANWGGSWRLPTEDEMMELIYKCSWTWTKQGGHNGYKVTSEITGKSIFLPTAGWYNDSSNDYESVEGCYWCSMPNEETSLLALAFMFNDSSVVDSYSRSHFGFNIRPVIDWSANNEIRPSTGMIAGHEYVDLGLSVKWATCNVGASTPSDVCNWHVAWGEITLYTEGSCKTFNDIAGDPRYDIARANWGDSWRMPTMAEARELIDNCSWTWTKRRGFNGYKVTSLINGNSIFLPAAGYIQNYATIFDQAKAGMYWCSTPDDAAKYRNCEYINNVYVLYFDFDIQNVIIRPYDFKCCVRPVTE